MAVTMLDTSPYSFIPFVEGVVDVLLFISEVP